MASPMFDTFAVSADVAPPSGAFTIDTALADWGVLISTTVTPTGTVSAVGPLDSDAPWWISDQPRAETAWTEHRALVGGFQKTRVLPLADRRSAAIHIAEAASTRTVRWRPEWHPPVSPTREPPLPEEVRERVFRPPVVPHR